MICLYHSSIKCPRMSRHVPTSHVSCAATGIKYKVLQRAYDTGNEYFTVEATLRTNATSYYDGYIGSPPEHIHLLQDETYTVVSGKMGYKIGQSAAPVAAGETVTVPKGRPVESQQLHVPCWLLLLRVSACGLACTCCSTCAAWFMTATAMKHHSC